MEVRFTFLQMWDHLLNLGIIEYSEKFGYMYTIPVYGRYEVISLGHDYDDAFNYFCTLNF